MTVIHLVYPSGNSIAAPWTIGRHLFCYLEERGYSVRCYQWDANAFIPARGDEVLLGHPHPAPQTIFRRSARQKGWKRILAIAPFNTDLRQVAFLDAVLPDCHRFLAITGNYWYRVVDESPVAHWHPKMIHLDLAVDRQEFPVTKRSFNPPGHRRFLYIGHSGWQKNPGYLSALASRMPDTEFGWMGSGRPIRGLTMIGSQDFSQPAARELVAGYDFLITVGKADANPTTILEAMAWGLLPICTSQSGYEQIPGILNIPVNNAETAAEILRRLQNVPDEELRATQANNWRLLDKHFNWNRFGRQIEDAILSNEAPNLLPISPLRRARLRWAAWVSPNAPLGPRNLVRRLYYSARRLAGGG